MTDANEKELAESLATRAARLAQLKEERSARRAHDIENLERDAPIREAFHAFAIAQGFREPEVPRPGDSYSGSHIDLLWHCFRHATLAERNRRTS